jgi:DNA-binding beta-propeller fold protein YncE
VLWVTGAERTVTPIDLASGAVRPPVAVGNGPIGVAVGGGAVWVANGDDGTVSRLDAVSGARRGDDVRVGSGPIAVEVSGDDVWVLNQDASTVSHLSARTGAPVEPDLHLPPELSRPRDLVATPDGVAVVGVDGPAAALLVAR